MSCFKHFCSIIDHKYTVGEYIAEGNHGCVYAGKNIESDETVAIKVVQAHEKAHLEMEFNLYESISKNFKNDPKSDHIGIPKYYYYGEVGSYFVLVMELLGPTLTTLFDKFKKNLSLKSVLMIADQLLDALQVIHESNYLYIGYKLENITIGLNSSCDNYSNSLFLIDFGRSLKYRNEVTSEYIEAFNCFTSCYYTFASLNDHRANPFALMGRNDDLESLGYLLLHLVNKGMLPWGSRDLLDWGESRYDRSFNIKKDVSIDDYCKENNIPIEFSKFIYYARSLKYKDCPDYEYVKNMFKDLFIQNNFEDDKVFEWNSTYCIDYCLNSLFKDLDDSEVSRSDKLKTSVINNDEELASTYSTQDYCSQISPMNFLNRRKSVDFFSAENSPINIASPSAGELEKLSQIGYMKFESIEACSSVKFTKAFPNMIICNFKFIKATVQHCNKLYNFKQIELSNCNVEV